MNKPRRDLIRATLPLVGYVKGKDHQPITDRNGLPTRLIVPGSEGKRYDVILRWDAQRSTVEAECRGDVDSHDCPGNGVSVCKHALSAVMRVLSDRGNRLSMCSGPAAAKNLSHIGHGRVIRVYSRQSKQFKYGVVRSLTHE